MDQHKVKKDGHSDTRMSVRDVLLVKGMQSECYASFFNASVWLDFNTVSILYWWNIMVLIQYLVKRSVKC